MRRQPLDRGVIEPFGGKPAALHQLVGEMRDQLRNVTPSLAEWRHMDRHDVEPVEQVLAKPALLDFRAEILVRGRDDAHVHRQCLAGSDAGDHAFLQGAQHLRLRRQAHIADFVEKQRAAVRQLELAGAIGERAGEAPLHVAEQLAFDQLRRNRGTVDRDERTGGARAERVNRARDELLAGAVIAGDQDARRRGRDLLDQADHRANRLAGADDLVLRADFLLEPHVFGNEHDVL